VVAISLKILVAYAEAGPTAPEPAARRAPPES